jgi:hypothetical protein
LLRIHDILMLIRIRGSMPLTNGSGLQVLATAADSEAAGADLTATGADLTAAGAASMAAGVSEE